ncbi:hypothetical protein Lfu02_28790 [Longispora fulva]|uniref:Uncharacterized protein n=1 Tax=Longispora fulva TaxID=619741 RepID=A0A8J7GH75_9ACTN|nr:hypothetical protein [Longispora fulva]MBG6139014.1 hypothetical protein [Longispora fulva]GIG58507.1 hypothetical protein Lfu02_28790 [Longispora fulva]
MAVVTAGPTRELPVLRDGTRTWRGGCPRCREGMVALDDAEATLVMELSGGRNGDWRADRCADRCADRRSWHLVRRTHHGRPRGSQAWAWVLVVAAALVVLALM